MSDMLQKIQSWDDKMILSIIAKRGLRLNRFMKMMSMMGDGYLWAVIAILICFFTDENMTWLTIGIVAFAIELILYKIIKQSTTRQRPYQTNPGIENLVIPPDQFSFPSGHTAAATVAALLFTLALPAFAPLFIVVAFVIGLSRIYLGVHYPTDVIIGFALGIVSFSISYFIF